MTWGEIQKISLEKMFAKDEPIEVEDIDDLKDDDDCSLYLSMMPAACNEAIERIKPHVMQIYQYNETTKKYDKASIEHVNYNTSANKVIDLPEDACVLIPLYIASQLYKDDDIAQATAYRNEFEVGLADLDYNLENQETIKEVF